MDKSLWQNCTIKYLISILFIFISHLVIASSEPHGFYAGIGSGLNMVYNQGLIKTYSTYGENIGYQYMGDVTGYSVPIFINFGYRFNQYFAAEAFYNYSGSQSYSQPEQNTKDQTDFAGSQNSFTMNALGYIPLVDNYLYIKGRLGIAYTLDTLTTYTGNPGTSNITSVMGAGLQYFMTNHLSLDFDYINYGALIPLNMQYQPPVTGGPNLGTVDSIIVNEFLLSLNVHF